MSCTLTKLPLHLVPLAWMIHPLSANRLALDHWFITIFPSNCHSSKDYPKPPDGTPPLALQRPVAKVCPQEIANFNGVISGRHLATSSSTYAINGYKWNMDDLATSGDHKMLIRILPSFVGLLKFVTRLIHPSPFIVMFVPALHPHCSDQEANQCHHGIIPSPDLSGTKLSQVLGLLLLM